MVIRPGHARRYPQIQSIKWQFTDSVITVVAGLELNTYSKVYINIFPGKSDSIVYGAHIYRQINYTQYTQ
jgi:hypothetical protein